MSDTPKAPETALCPQCGRSFEIRRNRRFCPRSTGRKCQADFNNRMAAEGKVLAPLVKAMFATRGGGHGGTLPVCGMARSELTRIARMLNDADKAAGRPPVHLYVQRLFDSGTLYMDRRRLPVAPVFTGRLVGCGPDGIGQNGGEGPYPGSGGGGGCGPGGVSIGRDGNSAGSSRICSASNDTKR